VSRGAYACPCPIGSPSLWCGWPSPPCSEAPARCPAFSSRAGSSRGSGHSASRTAGCGKRWDGPLRSIISSAWHGPTVRRRPPQPGAQAPAPWPSRTAVSNGGTASRRARSSGRPTPARRTRPVWPAAPPPAPSESRAERQLQVSAVGGQIVRDKMMADVQAVTVGAQEDHAAAADEREVADRTGAMRAHTSRHASSHAA
jgi:hypothetical protein